MTRINRGFYYTPNGSLSYANDTLKTSFHICEQYERIMNDLNTQLKHYEHALTRCLKYGPNGGEDYNFDDRVANIEERMISIERRIAFVSRTWSIYRTNILRYLNYPSKHVYVSRQIYAYGSNRQAD